MISTDTIEAYNTRLNVDLTNLKKLTPAQRDTVKAYGSQAEALLLNRDLAQFIHHFKFEINDALVNITKHDPEANAERIALANQLSGLDAFVVSLKRAVYHKNKVVQLEQQPIDSSNQVI